VAQSKQKKLKLNHLIELKGPRSERKWNRTGLDWNRTGGKSGFLNELPILGNRTSAGLKWVLGIVWVSGSRIKRERKWGMR